MRLRISVLTVGGVVTCLGLTACAGGAAPASDSGGATNAVSFESWSPIQQTTDQMVAAVQAANKGVTVKATIYNAPDYLVDLQTRAASNTMPDVVGLQSGAYTQQFRAKLMPLQDCAAKAWGADWKTKFFPIGLTEAQLGNPKGDTNFYSLPLMNETVNLWANTEILKANNATIPQTWDELVAFSKNQKGKDFAPFLMPALQGWNRSIVFLQIVNNVNPGLVYKAEDGTDKWTNPDIVKAFDYWQKLFTQKVFQDGAMGLTAYPDAGNQIEAGKAAIFPFGSWWIQQSDPTRSGTPPVSQGMAGWKPFLFPTIPGGASQPQLVGGMDVGLGMAKNTKNPELACKVLTDFIAGAGAQKMINTFNDVPAVVGLTPQKFTGDNQKAIWNTFMTDWLPNVKYSRYLADPKVDQAVNDALAALASGQTTPQDAAASVQKVQDQVSAG
jgi:raffinose/stachyose/melibiose transport system substrate-binding protein